MITLTYDGTANYKASLEDGRMLVVDGDAFAEARHDRVFAIMQDKNPALSRDELNDLIANSQAESEADKADTEVFNDLVQIDEWIDHATGVDGDGDLIDATAPAWIIRSDD